MAGVSVVVKPGKFPHPLQKVMSEVAGNGTALRSIKNEIRAKCKKTTPTLVDFAKLKADLMKSGSYDKLREMVKKSLKGEQEARNECKGLGVKPPYSSELYERVEKGAHITDLGCGEGKRVKRYEGFFGHVIGVDKIAKPKDWPLKWDYCQREVADEERIVTSFNVMGLLTQQEIEIVKNQDGLHIFADREQLLRNGHAAVVEDKVVCDMDGTVYEEERTQLPEGYAIKDNYLACNTYRAENIVCEVKRRCMGWLAKSFYRRATEGFEGFKTWKENGVFFEFRSNNGEFSMSTRNGKAVAGTINTKKKIVLHLERVGDVYYLIRVRHYRDFKPYHYYEGLVEFTKKVKIRIGGLDVLPPRPISEPRNGADGMVIREREMDIVCNFGISLDLFASARNELEKFLINRGAVGVMHVGDKGEGLFSVSVEELDRGITVCDWSKRTDKDHPDNRNCWDKKFALLTVAKIGLCGTGSTTGFEIEGEGVSDDEME